MQTGKYLEYQMHSADESVESCLQDIGISYEAEPTTDETFTSCADDDSVEDCFAELGLNYVDGKPLTTSEKVQAKLNDINKEYQAKKSIKLEPEPTSASGSISEIVRKYVA